MIRTYQGNLIKIDKTKFKNDYDYYRYIWNKKYKIKVNNQVTIKESLKKLVK